jgi:hypothetical protein
MLTRRRAVGHIVLAFVGIGLLNATVIAILVEASLPLGVVLGVCAFIGSVSLLGTSQFSREQWVVATDALGWSKTVGVFTWWLFLALWGALLVFAVGLLVR